MKYTLKSAVLALLLIATVTANAATKEVTVGELVYTIHPKYAAISGLSKEFSADAKELIIPESVEYEGKSYPVTTIKDEVFESKKLPEKIVIPSSITDFNPNGGNSTFYQSSGIREAIFLPGTIEELPFSIFRKCKSLEKVTLPDNVKKIGIGAFGESGIMSIEFGKNLEEIGPAAFSTCERLESIIIPEGVSRINYGAFDNCSNLKKVTLPSTLVKYSSIQNGTAIFHNCKSLTEVTLTPGITVISGFDGCSSLKQITIPKSVIKVEKYAFYGTGLENIVFEGSPALDESWIGYSRDQRTDIYIHSAIPPEANGNISYVNNIYTHIPKGSYDRYMAQGAGGSTAFWSKTNLIEDLPNSDDWSDDSNMAVVKVKGTDTHTTRHYYPTGHSAKIDVTPEEGWTIDTVKFNGEDVTSQLDNNAYLTAPLSGENLLEVVMRDNGTSGVESPVEAQKIKVVPGQNEVSVYGAADGSVITVYSPAGETVYEGTETRIPLGSGVYILKVGNRSYKFAV